MPPTLATVGWWSGCVYGDGFYYSYCSSHLWTHLTDFLSYHNFDWATLNDINGKFLFTELRNYLHFSIYLFFRSRQIASCWIPYKVVSQLNVSKYSKNNKNNKRQHHQQTHFTNQRLQNFEAFFTRNQYPALANPILYGVNSNNSTTLSINSPLFWAQ